ncbi:hypothetical protein Q5O24_13745 [Eubacteriaceae bacterium ES3]|nr:hypothetical protein Q5O24_13745 [Eubacteriaceae bacterium ES3]
MTKKLMAGLAVLMMVGTAGTVMAAPQNGSGVCDGTGQGIGNDGVKQYQYDSTYDENFVDEDGDGVCDNEPQFLEMRRGQR